jgi:hypothetical protein
MQRPSLLHVRHSATQSTELHEPGRMTQAEPLLDVEVDDELEVVLLVLLEVVVLVLLDVVLVLLDEALLALLALELDDVPSPPLPPLPPVAGLPPVSVPAVPVAPPCPPLPVLLVAPPVPTIPPPRGSRLLPCAQLAATAPQRKRIERKAWERMVPSIIAGSRGRGKRARTWSAHRRCPVGWIRSPGGSVAARRRKVRPAPGTVG